MVIETLHRKALEQKQRHEQGWRTARAVAHLLHEKYQVSKIILFGSLLTPQWMRPDSDVDLAVWGLTDTHYYQALQDIAALSTEISVDLVQIESAQPSLLHKINTQGQVLDQQDAAQSSWHLTSAFLHHSAMNERAVLWGQIQQELTHLSTLVQRSQTLLAKLRATQDEDYLGTLALDLHGFYGGVERMFKQIAQTIDGSVPDRADWHRQLLRQMAAPVLDRRPAIISPELLSLLDEYCSFRHVVRNIYSISLKLDRVERLTDDLPRCFSLLQAELQAFIALSF